MVKGNHSQVSAMMIEVSAQLGSVISAGTFQPSARKRPCMGLMSGV